jgi:hypothetical protein
MDKKNFKIFIDFKPAELKLGIDWIVVFYAKNPITGKLERFRKRVPPNKTITERIRWYSRNVEPTCEHCNTYLGTWQHTTAIPTISHC